MKLRVQRGDGRGSCNLPQRGAADAEACRPDAGRFGCSFVNRGQKAAGKCVIETLGRQADLAFLGSGMMLDIQLVQHQAELADEQHNDK